MDLEKLVALGEKMGLSGAELRKWVSQKEKKKERGPRRKKQQSLKERGPNDPECLGEDPKIEPSSTQEPRREGAAEGNFVKDATRAQDEAEVRKKVNHEVIVPDEKTCRAGDVPTKRPPTTMSEKRTKSVAQTEHCVVPELAKHQQRTEEHDNDLPMSNVSMVAETPSTKPSSETARRKKNRKNKKRSSEHRKKGRKRGMRHEG
ncbi:hypothetical protein MTO96_023895 [Rhipicephalus appendiculatus]